MQSNGIISKTLDWFTHPSYAESTPIDWAAFVVLLIMAGLLWSRVVKKVLD